MTTIYFVDLAAAAVLQQRDVVYGTASDLGFHIFVVGIAYLEPKSEALQPVRRSPEEQRNRSLWATLTYRPVDFDGSAGNGLPGGW